MRHESQRDGGLVLELDLSPPGPMGRTRVHLRLTEADFWKVCDVIDRHRDFLVRHKAMLSDWLTGGTDG